LDQVISEVERYAALKAPQPVEFPVKRVIHHHHRIAGAA
jgi:hypothetical protein